MNKGKYKSITSKLKKISPIYFALLIIACISAAIIFSMGKDKVITQKTYTPTATEDFQFTIIGLNSDSATACYKSIVYLDGYAYSPSEWLSYSRSESDYDKLKGEKLGTVTLDLKDKSYTGTPPSFSSTLNEGTEIYTVKNMKKERAILVIDDNYARIFYREGKALNDEKTPINLTLAAVFNMMSDSQKVSSVELRSEENGSVIGVSENKQLLELINKELPNLPILQPFELGKDPYSIGKRIAINLMFSDGAALHMQVIPKAKSASVFGGFVQLSEELCSAVQELPKQVN